MSIEPKLAERLLTLRTERGLTQEEAAEKIGVSNKTYSKWETGSTSPDIETVVKLSQAFGVTADHLLGLSDSVPVSFEDAVRTEADRNPDNPVKAFFNMYETLIGVSFRIFEDWEEKRKWLPADPGEYPDYPRCVVSDQNAYQMSVISPAMNFVFALFRNGENFGWLKEEDKLTVIASLFALLADPDALKILHSVHDESFPSSFTAAYIGEQTGIAEEKAEPILRQMEHFRLCTSETAHLADGEVKVYWSRGEGRILGLIAIAYEHCFGKIAHRLGVNTLTCNLIGGEAHDVR